MRLAGVSAAVLVLLTGWTSPSSAQGRVLSIRPHQQHTIVWCWGAAAAMVVEFETRRPTEDCEVLSAYDRRYGAGRQCCVSPGACLRGAIPGEIETILGTVFSIHGRSQPFAASFEQVRDHLDTGHPLILWLWRSPTTAHVVVIAGYRPDRSLLVLDPMQGPAWVDYSVLRANWQTGEWRDTIFVNGVDSPGPGPNPRPLPPPTSPRAAHWCCTPMGRLGPYLPNDVPVGASCQWPVPGVGMVLGTACD